MCIFTLIEALEGRYRYYFVGPKFNFVPNDTVPGQDDSAMMDFKRLRLKQGDIDRLFSCFLEIDTDGSGEISLDEFYEHFKLPRTIFSDMAFTLMDEDKSGEIDFREFILTLWNFCSYDLKNLCRFSFHLFDTDESGKLDQQEVEDMVSAVYGEKFADDVRVKKVLDLLDANGDGQVSMAEWVLFNKQYPLLLFPAYQLQGILREKVIGKWWWDIMQEQREEHFRNSNIYDILEQMEEDNIKYGDESAPEEINDINNSAIRSLPTQSRGSEEHFSDKNSQQQQPSGGDEKAQAQAYESPFKNNAFLATLKAQKARPPSQQTSLQDWRPSTGPGNPAMFKGGYFTGDKKDWKDAPRRRQPEGSVKVMAGG